MAPSRGVRRAPAALAPALRAPPSGPAVESSSAPRRAATPSRSIARRVALRCAARCRCTPARVAGAVRRGFVRRALDRHAADAARRLGPDGPGSGCSARGRGQRREVVSQHRPRRRDAGRRRRRGRHRRRRVAVGLEARAAVQLVARVAKRVVRVTAKRGGGGLMDRAGDHPPGRLREELRARGGRQVHVPRARPRAQDADPPGDRGAVRRQAWSRSARIGQEPSPSAAGGPPGRTRAVEEGDRRGARRASAIPIFRGPARRWS